MWEPLRSNDHTHSGAHPAGVPEKGETRQMESRIFWAGDSTVTQNSYLTYPQSGIGQGIRLFIRPEVEIKNHAVNGRSTKSFLDQSRLAPIYDRMTEGDFLFIQFGHNDEKAEDPLRYTDPFGEYQENLGKFVAAAQNKRAYPLLITPLYRRTIREDGSLNPDEHKEYRAAMLETARALGIPCLDLCAASRRLLERTPHEVSRKWFMNLEPGEYPNCPEGKTDNTHLQWNGALVFGGLLAAGLKKLGGRYAALLIEPDRITEEFEGEVVYGKD